MAVKKPDPKTIISEVAATLNAVSKKHNFQVAPTQKLGKPSKTNSTVREFRMQLVVTSKDTSETFKTVLQSELKKAGGFTKITFNKISPNSSKYSSVSFVYGGMKFDAVIAKGANKGENFEKKTITDLSNFFKRKGVNKTYQQLVEKLTQSNPAFGINEITSVTQRTGSTKKEGVPTADLGAIIGDIVVKDSGRNTWFISLKDVNGNTFSSYSGAASLFDASGTLQPDSAGAKFLNSFGVDLNQVQKGFDERNGIKKKRPKLPVAAPDKTEMKAIFERAWGMNYFYVRKVNSTDWKVFWMSKAKLNSLTNNMTVSKVNYPNPGSKQITIFCSTPSAEYTIELRNSKAQEYPNDTKFKIIKFK